MKAVIDSNVLMQILGELSNGLVCPITKAEIDKLEGRADALLERYSPNDWMILIPAPVIAEVFIKIDKAKHQEYVNRINAVSSISIVAFDELCAITCANIISVEEAKQMKSPADTWAKVAIDRQIISIAKAHNADEVWSHDIKVLKKSKALGMKAMSLADIEPIPRQASLGEF